MEWEYISIGKGWIVDSNHDGNSITNFLNKTSSKVRGGGWELVSQRVVYTEEVFFMEEFDYEKGKPVASGKFKGAFVSRVVGWDPAKLYGERQKLNFIFKRPKK